MSTDDITKRAEALLAGITDPDGYGYRETDPWREAAPSLVRGLLDEVRRLETERDRLDAALDDEIAERAHCEAQINEIADALGDDTEWSNLNDRGVNAIDAASAVTAEVATLRDEVARLKAALVEACDLAHDGKTQLEWDRVAALRSDAAEPKEMTGGGR